MLFADALDLFIRFHLSRLASGKYVKTRVLEKFIPFLGKQLEEVTPIDVYTWYTSIGAQHPQTANKALSYLRTMYQFLGDLHVFWGASPAVGIRRYPGYPRKRFVQPSEMRRLLHSLAQEGGGMSETYFMLLLTTGCRPREARLMQWGHVDLESGRWDIPVTKSRRPHVLMLPVELIARLQQLKMNLATAARQDDAPAARRTENGVDVLREAAENACDHDVSKPGQDRPVATYIFSSRHNRPWSHSTVQNHWHRIKTRAGLPDVQLRDLRRTVASWMEEAGVSITDIGQVLNHASQKTTIWYLAGLRPHRAIQQHLSQHLDRILAYRQITQEVPHV